MNKTKDPILVLSAHFPSSRSKEAGQKIVFDHIKKMSLHYRVFLVSFANQKEVEEIDQQVYELCEEVHIVQVNAKTRLLGLVTGFQLPWYVAFRKSHELQKILRDLTNKHCFRVFWFEYMQMIQYIGDCHKKCVTKSFVFCHDVISQMHERKVEKSKGWKRLLHLIEYRRTLTWEKRELKKIDNILVISEKDKQLLYPYKLLNVEVINPAISPNIQLEERSFAPNPQLVFFGAMNRFENEDAVLWFLEEIFPLIKKEISHIHFNIVGANPTKKLQTVCSGVANVTLTGFVENPIDYFKSAWLAVAPLRYGAGVKIKVLESLANGVPMVATGIGAEGIKAGREDGILVYEEPAAFAIACIDLLKDQNQCEKLSVASRKWFVEKYMPSEFTEERLNDLLK